MNASEYAKAMETARAEVQRLLEQRSSIDARLANLRKSIRALSHLLASHPGDRPVRGSTGVHGLPAEYGLTDAIRKLLSTHGELSTVKIREELNKDGFDINSYASGLTVIHNTLRRLKQQNEIDLVKGPNGTTAYPLQKGK